MIIEMPVLLKQFHLVIQVTICAVIVSYYCEVRILNVLKFMHSIKCIKYVSPFLIAILTLTGSVRGEADDFRSCALEAYQVCCHVFGKSPQAITLSDQQRTKGVTLWELSNWLKSTGLEVQGIKCELSDLCNDGAVYIAHVENRHYVVVSSVRNSELAIIDPPDPQYLMSKSDFKKKWTGVALKVRGTGDKVIPSLALAKKKIDLGRYGVAEGCKFEIKLSNISTTSIIVNSVKVSCGCLSPELSNCEIAPGNSVSVPVNFLGRQTVGNFSVQVVIQTNDGKYPLIVSEITGEIERRDQFIPSIVNFGVVASGHSAIGLISFKDAKFFRRTEKIKLKTLWTTDAPIRLQAEVISENRLKLIASANTGEQTKDGILDGTDHYVQGSVKIQNIGTNGVLLGQIVVPVCAKLTLNPSHQNNLPIFLQ